MKISERGTADHSAFDGLELDPATQKGLAQILKYVETVAIGNEASLTPDAQFQLDFRSSESRAEKLHKFAAELSPPGAYLQPWADWRATGTSPFAGTKLMPVGSAKENPAQTLSRATDRIEKQEAKIEKKRAALRAEEEQLDYMKAMEKLSLSTVVQAELFSLFKVTFAMGPAWTIMRALSGYATDAFVAEMTAFFDGKAKILEEQKVRAEQREEHEKIMKALDMHAGDEAFERRLREAILGVIDTYQGSSETGYAGRSRKAMREAINPRSAANFEDVLDSHSRDRDRTDDDNEHEYIEF